MHHGHEPDHLRRQLSLDHFKIDSSFVCSMDTGESRKIVGAMVGLGEALGIPVTAEGIESAEVAATLLVTQISRCSRVLSVGVSSVHVRHRSPPTVQSHVESGHGGGHKR